MHFEKSGLSDKKNWNCKIKNTPKFSNENALKLFINACFECTTIDKIAEILTGKFIKVHVPLFSDFAFLKLNELNDLGNYFRKKD